MFIPRSESVSDTKLPFEESFLEGRTDYVGGSAEVNKEV